METAETLLAPARAPKQVPEPRAQARELRRNSRGTVIGLAPTAASAEVLSADLAAPTDTVTKCVQLTAAPPGDRGGATHPSRRSRRAWFDTIGADTLLIVDESGMASTIDLDAIGHALARGASVHLIGDDQELASISAGGVLRDLADRHDALALNAVVRLTHPQTGRAEGAASMALRAGDPAGIGFYIDHHRVHVGTDALAADIRYATAATWQSSKLPISTANRLPGCDCHGVCHRGSAVTDRRLGAGHPAMADCLSAIHSKTRGRHH